MNKNWIIPFVYSHVICSFLSIHSVQNTLIHENLPYKDLENDIRASIQSPDKMMKVVSRTGINQSNKMEYLKEFNEQFNVRFTPSDLTDPKKLKSIIKAAKIKLMPDKQRIIAIKIIIDFVDKFSKRLDKQREYVFDYKVDINSPVFEVKTKDTISDFNIRDVGKIVEQFQGMDEIWKIYNSAVRQCKTGKNCLNPYAEQSPNDVRELYKSIEEPFKEFYQDYKIFKARFVIELKKWESGVKDMMTFYEALPRFYVVFLTNNEKAKKLKPYKRIWELRNDWVKQTIRAIQRMKMLILYVELIYNYDFFQKQPDSDQFMNSYHRLILNFKHVLTYSTQIFKSLSRNFLENERHLKYVIRDLESRNDIYQKRFVRHYDIYEHMSMHDQPQGFFQKFWAFLSKSR